MNFEPGVTPYTASFSPLQQDLAFEFGVDIINHLQSPSPKFELIALRYSGSREIENGVTPATELPRLPYKSLVGGGVSGWEGVPGYNISSCIKENS